MQPRDILLFNITVRIKNNKLDQLQCMSAKMVANGIGTHARNNQWRTLESRSRQSLNAGRL